MSDPDRLAFPTYQSLLLRWTRAHTLGAVVALAILLLTILLQITLLSGWHFAQADTAIPLAPSSPSVTASNEAIQYSFVGSPAVASTRTMSVATEQILGMLLTFDQIPPNTRLSLGWISTHDRGKPTQLAVTLPGSIAERTVYVPLRGSADWRDRTTQVAIALSAPAGTTSVALERAEWVSANPGGALWHAWGSWSQRSNDVTPAGSTERVLPLAAWLSLASVVALALVSLVTRKSMPQRRDALLGAAAVLTAAIVVSVSAATFALPSTMSFAAIAWIFFALVCLGLVAKINVLEKLKLPLFTPSEWVSIVFSVIAGAVGGAKLAWVPIMVIAVLLARKSTAIFAKWSALIYALPLILALALAQAWVAELFSVSSYALIDPTRFVLSSIWRIGGFASVIVLALALYAFWPVATARTRRNDLALGLWLSLIAIVCVFAVVPANVRLIPALPTISAFAIWLGLAALCIAWLAPSALAPVGEQEAVAVQRTEFDLSNAARQLFDAAAASADAAFASNRSGAALAPLQRMKELAPTSLRTFAAELRYAIASGRSSDAAAAYAALKAQPLSALDETAIETMLGYAEHVDDFETVLAATARLPQSEAMSRKIARAELLRTSEANAGVDRALEVLLAVPEPNALAHEIAELHLLRDDWQAAQKALAKSAFTPQSIIGSIYVARLGLRATNGSVQYVEQLQKLATWNNTLGAAQIGMGETLLRQENANGARARFMVARNLDSTLWAIERRIRDIASAREASNDTAASAGATGRVISLA